jgi:hypothetical protein
LNSQIGQYISSNGGVVTAEELAPFLDVPPPSEESKAWELLPIFCPKYIAYFVKRLSSLLRAPVKAIYSSFE